MFSFVAARAMQLLEACAAAVTGAGMLCAWRLLSKLKAPDGVDPRELAGRWCSAVHAATTGTMAVLAVAGAMDPRIGAIGMAVSIGYFVHDSVVVISLRTQPMVPILAHHVLCSGCMAAVLHSARPFIWYANLLQWTECTIPIQFACWLMEIHAVDVARPRAYALGRWLMTLAWVMLRLVLMVGFFYLSWRDWSSFSAIARFSSAVIGPFLTAFNIGGFLMIILPGMPWWPPKVKGKQQ